MEGKYSRWIAGAAVVLALSALVFGVLGRSDDRPRRPVFSPQWDVCAAGEACVAVQAPCGEWQPVSANHESDAAAYYNHLMTVVEETGMECFSTNLTTRKPAAVCLAGRCTLSQ